MEVSMMVRNRLVAKRKLLKKVKTIALSFFQTERLLNQLYHCLTSKVPTIKKRRIRLSHRLRWARPSQINRKSFCSERGHLPEIRLSKTHALWRWHRPMSFRQSSTSYKSKTVTTRIVSRGLRLSNRKRCRGRYARMSNSCNGKSPRCTQTRRLTTSVKTSPATPRSAASLWFKRSRMTRPRSVSPAKFAWQASFSTIDTLWRLATKRIGTRATRT